MKTTGQRRQQVAGTRFLALKWWLLPEIQDTCTRTRVVVAQKLDVEYQMGTMCVHWRNRQVRTSAEAE